MRTCGAACAAVFAAVLATQALAADPPKTTITSGPNGESVLTSPQFTFSADQPSTFECSLDGAPFQACTSPRTLRDLALGPHAFSVRAIGADGQPDPAPATRTWSVVAPPSEIPRVTVKKPRAGTLRIRSLRTLSGTAASVAGVKEVDVALTFGGPDKNYFPAKCWYVDMRTGRLVLQTCLIPHYTKAKGTTAWRYNVPAAVRKRIPDGPYTLLIRAFNRFGEATQKKVRLRLR